MKLIHIYFHLRSRLRLGNRLFCPCCGRMIPRFLPYGTPPRPRALCPFCHSLERHRLLWLYLEKRTRLFHDHLALLHVAPEPILQKKFRQMPNLRYVSIDLASPAANLKMDLTRLGFRPDSFDAIICSHVLEHIEDDRQALRELFRVLKPGGFALIQSPLDPDREKTYEDPGITGPEARARAFGQRNHVRTYGRDYRERLGRAGFAVKVEKFTAALSPDLIGKFGLNRGEDIYLCTKPG